MKSQPPDALDLLLRARPEEFTAERQRMVKLLRSRGRAQEARDVAAIAKPPLVVWALDAAVRAAPKLAAAVIDTGNDLRRAQQHLAASERAGALQEAASKFHAAARTLTTHAGEMLRSVGHPPSASFLARIERTITATATAKRAEREAFTKGRLMRELSPADFADVLQDLPLRQDKKATRVTSPNDKAATESARKKAAQNIERVTRERQRIEKARVERETSEKRRQLAAVQKALRKAEEQAERSEEAAQKAEAKARELRDVANDARRALAEARARLLSSHDA